MLERWKVVASFSAGLVLTGWGAVRWSQSGFAIGSRARPDADGQYVYVIGLGVALLATGFFTFWGLRDRAPLPVRCPACGASVAWRHVTPDRPFFCPSCQQGIALSGVYFRVVYGLSAIVVAVTGYLLGVRGELLFWLIVLGIFPTYIVLSYPSIWLVAPGVAPTGDFRAMLRGDSATEQAGPDSTWEHESTTAAPWLTGSARAPDRPSRSLRPPAFVQIRPPVSIEGCLLKTGFCVMYGYGVWVVVKALIERLW